jgi:uncharacterized protein YdhG (YjbR/CyaY superfamily)
MMKAVVPDAIESISYGIPIFKYQGRPLIYCAAAKKHCLYGTSKGTIRFQPREPLPKALVTSWSTRESQKSKPPRRGASAGSQALGHQRPGRHRAVTSTGGRVADMTP